MKASGPPMNAQIRFEDTAAKAGVIEVREPSRP